MMPGNPVVGGTVLRRAAIQSPNYIAGSQGWSINADGSAEFNNLTIRGQFIGANYVLNSNGEFFYSSTPAAGNLIFSNSNSIVTDPFGNVTPNPGATSYFNSGSGYVSLNINGGALSWATATTEAGPWTVAGEIGINIGSPTDLIIDFASWTHP